MQQKKKLLCHENIQFESLSQIFSISFFEYMFTKYFIESYYELSFLDKTIQMYIRMKELISNMIANDLKKQLLIRITFISNIFNLKQKLFC